MYFVVQVFAMCRVNRCAARCASQLLSRLRHPGDEPKQPASQPSYVGTKVSKIDDKYVQQALISAHAVMCACSDLSIAPAGNSNYNGNSVEAALMRFRRTVSRSGHLQELRWKR